jgi:L-fuconolactonase
VIKIDAHQHFWRYNARDYGWIGPHMEVLKRDYMPGELRPLQRQVGIEGTVAVQARQTVGETRWLLELAARHPFIKGVVGWVDLCDPGLATVLDVLSTEPKLCGVRHVVQDEPDDGFLLREDFCRGIGMLARYDLAYDLLIYGRHLRVACDFVERFPEQRFVLDHMAKPPIATGEIGPWADGLRRLAEHRNVACKVSGMVTEADWGSWQPSDMRPYLDVAFEAFGVGRILLGSDWPVCTVAGDYAQVMQVATDYVAEFTAEAQAAVCGGNAARFYRLERHM